MTTKMSGTELGEALVSGMQSGDIAKVMSAMHPDVRIHEPDSLPFGGWWTGHDAFTELVGKISTLATIQVERGTVFDAGDAVIIKNDVTFISHKDGEKLETSLCEINHIEDGLMRTIDVYYKDVVVANQFFDRQ